MTTTVKAADAAQFLSLVPRLLGYTPTRSIVIVPMTGGRSVGAMRLDLPDDDAVAKDDGFAATVIGMVCRIATADGLMTVIYTDEPARDDGRLPHAALADGIARTADASGLHLIDAFVVCADGWGTARGEGAALRPLSELISAAPAGVSEARGDQYSGTDLPRRSADDRRRAAEAHRALSTALTVVCGLPPESDRASRIDPAALEAACELDDLPAFYESALHDTPDTLAPMRAALVAWCLSRPSLRDIALVQWASDIGGGEQAMEAQRRWEDGAEYPVDLAAVMWGEGARPDARRLETALSLTRHVAALTAKRRRAGVLSVCGWLSWALGRSTHADAYARAATRIDPDHGLAQIVRSFVAATHLPDWAFDRADDR